jgi:hypothetical protein
MVNLEFESIEAIANAFPNEESCMQHLEYLRWNGFVTSPFDPFSKVYKCSGSRYRCRNTGKYFNAKTGTLFYNSKIELQKWFMAIWIITNAEKNITSTELGVDLGITQKSAWYLLRRIKRQLGIGAVETGPNKPEQKIGTVSQKDLTIEEIDVVVEKDKLQMLEWLQLLKK